MTADTPNAMPRMCGIVRAKPKAAPDAVTITVFGPGVIEPTNANRIRERSV
jgi:hypothetical protein